MAAEASEAIATRFVGGIEAIFEPLRQFPYSGPALPVGRDTFWLLAVEAVEVEKDRIKAGAAARAVFLVLGKHWPSVIGTLARISGKIHTLDLRNGVYK